MFKIGDRVASRGINSRLYGVGKVTDVKLNVATVLYDCGRIEAYNVAMLRKVVNA